MVFDVGQAAWGLAVACLVSRGFAQGHASATVAEGALECFEKRVSYS
jgi:hypothetical protein